MASRDSQGLQIALIIFVMVTVVLAVTTFVFYSSSEQYKKQAAEAKKNEQTAHSSFTTENAKVQYLKHVLGAAHLTEAEIKPLRESVVADPEMKAVDDQYQEHMKTFGEGLAQESLDYAHLLQHMMTALRSRNESNSTLSAQVNQLNDDKKKLQEDEGNRTAEAVNNLKKASDDLAAERQQFKQDRDSLQSQQEKELAVFKKNLGKLAGEVQTAKKSEDDKKEQMKQAGIVIDNLKKKLDDLTPRSFETADGQVTFVNQRANTVWINLGSADGLRRQTLFSVYGQEENGAARAERKASIEVTRVINDHLAEARIVSDEPGDPILPGDQIFSPAWRPGETVHFALAGKLDIDGDRRSDFDFVKSLIEASGGTIDAWAKETGESWGQVTASTRYLVVGDPPEDRKVMAPWNKILTDAELLGVEKLQLDQLLTLIGYQRETRTVPLGRASRSEDFKASAKEGKAPASTGNVSDVFKERKPPADAASK